MGDEHRSDQDHIRSVSSRGTALPKDSISEEHRIHFTSNFARPAWSSTLDHVGKTPVRAYRARDGSRRSQVRHLHTKIRTVPHPPQSSQTENAYPQGQNLCFCFFFVRISPYFFNAGLISSGSMLSTLSAGYASLIHSALDSSDYAKFDVLFGPAYKGISLAACTAMVLHRDYGLDVGFAYDRKEAKDHGEGGSMVGAPVNGKKVLILDDVMTAGTATRNAVDMIRGGGGEVVGIALCLDREEVGKEGGSTVKEMEKYVGGPGRIKSILRMRDLMAWLEGRDRAEDLAAMKDYWDKYGVKDGHVDK
jgi:orotate phosphoribosyltransferase